MEIREGTNVLTADGQKAGEVDRVVLDPVSKEVTHLVVQQGFLFKTERVIPISIVGPSTDDSLTLWQMAEEVEQYPDFREQDFVAAHVHAGSEKPDGTSTTWARPLYPYPPFALPGRMAARRTYGVPEYVRRVEENIPSGTVALEAGAEVAGSDGERIGVIDRVFVDSETEQATHLVIETGMLAKNRKIVPVSWIQRIREARVELLVESEVVRDLPDYEEES